MDVRLGRQPLHLRFAKHQFLEHLTKKDVYIQILDVLPGGYEVEVFIQDGVYYEGAKKTNLPKMHVHNHFKGIKYDSMTTSLKLMKRLYGK